MAQLSDEQVDLICQRIAGDGVVTGALQQDLLDHYCCYIEEELDNGSTFDKAYQEAFLAITPNGMHEIEEELFFLLTFKKQTNMKRLIYGAGFLSAFGICMGMLFKILHWPGAAVILFSGFSALIITMGALLIHSMVHIGKYPTDYKVRIFAGFIAGLLIASGSMFKMLYYPTANMQLLLGMVILNFIFLPMFFYQLYRQSLSKI